MVILHAGCQRGRHEEAALKLIVILRPGHPCHVAGGAIGVHVIPSAVIAVAVYVLCRGVSRETVTAVGCLPVILQAAGVYGVLGLLCHTRLVRRALYVVSTTAHLLYVMVLQSEALVVGQPYERPHAECLPLYPRQLRVSVAIGIIAPALPVLREEVEPCLAVVRDKRGVQRRVVVKRRAASKACQGV